MFVRYHVGGVLPQDTGGVLPAKVTFVSISPLKNQYQCSRDELVKNKGYPYCKLAVTYLFQSLSIIRRFHISPKRSSCNFYPQKTFVKYLYTISS